MHVCVFSGGVAYSSLAVLESGAPAGRIPGCLTCAGPHLVQAAKVAGS